MVKMHVLIIEAVLTGHHSGYLTHIAAAYMDAGHNVTVTAIQRDAAHPAIDRLKTQFGDAFSVMPLDDAKYDAALHSRLGKPGSELALRRLFGQAYSVVHRAKAVDYVFLPYLDYCLFALGLLGSPFGLTQWGGICMRPSFHYKHFGVSAPTPKLAATKRTLFLRLLRSKTLKSLYTIDELLHRFVSERHSHWTERLQYVPDPAELNGSHTYESAREAFGIPNGAVVVLVYGALDGRKGMDVLVTAMSSPGVPSTLQLLVAGKQSASIQLFMQTPIVQTLTRDGRCHVINCFVDAKIEQMVFSASDIVWLGYRNHYSMSGVLILSEIAGKPIIGTKEGLIGWFIKNRNLGSAVDITNQAEIRTELIKISTTDKNKLKDNGSYTAKTHTWVNLTSKVTKII